MKKKASLIVTGKVQDLEKILSESGIDDINEREKGLYYSMLTIAVSQVQPAIVKLLLDYGADVNILDRYGRPPLYYVGEEQSQLKHDSPEKHVEIANLLLNAGADVNIEDEFGNQPLWNTVFTATKGIEGYLKLMELLLKKGANPNHIGKAGNSPLSFAEKVGHEPIIKIMKAYIGIKLIPVVSDYKNSI